MSTFKGWRCDQCGKESRGYPNDDPAAAPTRGWLRINRDGRTTDVCSTACGKEWLTSLQEVVEESAARQREYQASRDVCDLRDVMTREHT